MKAARRLGVTTTLLLTVAASPSHAQSAQTLAGMQAYNTGDIAAAWRLLNAAAKAGDPEAQVNLGYLYARGQGVLNAMYNLGISFLQGHGAAIEQAEGTRWMRRAAENGQAAAQAWMRQNGYAGPLPRAVNWAAMMVPTVRHAAGHTKVCGTPVS